MIKRILNIALLALLLVACEQDNLITQQPQTEVEVTFNFEFEDVAVTRAISDGTTADELMYAIFNAQNNELVISKATKKDATGATTTEGLTTSMTLTGGVKYKAVFWLQSSLSDAYTVSDDMKVTVSYASECNDETRDAFYGVSKEFTIDDSSVGVILRRPFAQLNAGTYPFDWEYVEEFHGFDITKSCLRVRNVAHTIDLSTGELSDFGSASFKPGALPAESLKADVDENGVMEDYTYVAMAYLLADTTPSTHSAEFFFLNDQN
ncbi:MAG: hypothetical protein IIX58_01605, partial [Alistipes sp.]|nr:hypothetical protein [Alistipes sp.]